MTVHSTQLGHAAALASSTATLYTTPAGKRTIVKGLWARNKSAGVGVVYWEVVTAGGDTLAWGYPLAATGAGVFSIFLDVWMVLNVGDMLKVVASGCTIDAIASGAELTL